MTKYAGWGAILEPLITRAAQSKAEKDLAALKVNVERESKRFAGD
jgi:hypothetical protein